MSENAIGREIPDSIPGCEKLKPFQGAFANTPLVRQEKGNRNLPRLNKLLDTVEQAVLKTGLKDGMTISFHHHFRNGDKVVNMVLDVIANLGIKNLTLASSSLTTVHDELLPHIKNRVISRIITSGLRSRLGEQISAGIMDVPVLFHSHGGRARAVETGQIKIDVAFLGVPSSDVYGNANGFTGTSACGSLGYAIVDAKHASRVVLITDNLVEYPNTPFSIDQDLVDHIVVVDSVGDSSRIATGATRITSNPKDLLIAQNAADVIAYSPYFEDGFSLQTGSGGASLATTRYLSDYMRRRGVTCSWALGGITSQIVRMHQEGLIKRMLDVQSFDLDAVNSIAVNPMHTEIDASYYANPLNKGCAVNKLNVVVLSALEIDTNFNVNVLTGSDGIIMGASGGHSDTAVGSGLSVVVAPLIRGRISSVVDRVLTVVTPGESVDILVTDRGIAINPRRKDLVDYFHGSKLPLYTIQELKERAERVAGTPEPIKFGDKVVGLVEYRDGTIIDVIRNVAD
ncbi:citrate lyase subunit alpha [Marispirochaeta aestuarii]|uniref:Citrate lyase alpha chain n=1 Tax=Marispirochaeta aestuarii TaxID=1963862 RepID=A0A1Y1RZD6_9SPIO|nr:citrate lyase subunit alpha [Marispirochaeta aestuarii]ORC35394.1 citrate lyase subunit alpha [Marispirochaeta aestuarii]